MLPVRVADQASCSGAWRSTVTRIACALPFLRGCHVKYRVAVLLTGMDCAPPGTLCATRESLRTRPQIQWVLVGRCRCNTHMNADTLDCLSGAAKALTFPALHTGHPQDIPYHVNLAHYTDGIALAAFHFYTAAKRDNSRDDQDNPTPLFPSANGAEPHRLPEMQNQKTRLVCCEADL